MARSAGLAFSIVVAISLAAASSLAQHVRVVEKGGGPIGAVVLWPASSEETLGITNAAGEVTLARDCEIWCWHVDFVPQRVRAEAGRATVELERGGAIRGKVLDAWGEPIAGALVTAIVGAPTKSGVTGTKDGGLAYRRAATTDKDGAFAVSGLSRGVHLLRADHPGFVAAFVGQNASTARCTAIEVDGDVQTVELGMEQLFVGVLHLSASVPAPIVGRQVGLGVDPPRPLQSLTPAQSGIEREVAAAIRARMGKPGGQVVVTVGRATGKEPRRQRYSGAGALREGTKPAVALDVSFVAWPQWQPADACVVPIEPVRLVTMRVRAPMPVMLLQVDATGRQTGLGQSDPVVEADGRQRFDVPAGLYDVCPQNPHLMRGKVAKRSAERITVRERDDGGDVVVGREWAPVAGLEIEVVDAAGQPTREFVVQVQPEASGTVFTFGSELTGDRMTHWMEPGRVQVTVMNLAFEVVDRQDVVVAAGKTTPHHVEQR